MFNYFYFCISLLACLNIISRTKFFQIIIGISLLHLTLDFRFFNILGLCGVIKYELFHFVEHRRQKPMLFHHHRQWAFQSTFPNQRPPVPHNPYFPLWQTSIIKKRSTKSGDLPWSVTHHIICFQCFWQRRCYDH